MSHFGLIRPFDIDGGELDGLRPSEIFVLGYECCKIDELLKKPEGFSELVHSENIQRISSQAIREHRACKFIWLSEDQSEQWVQLEVLPSAPDQPKET